MCPNTTNMKQQSILKNDKLKEQLPKHNAKSLGAAEDTSTVNSSEESKSINTKEEEFKNDFQTPNKQAKKWEWTFQPKENNNQRSNNTFTNNFFTPQKNTFFIPNKNFTPQNEYQNFSALDNFLNNSTPNNQTQRTTFEIGVKPKQKVFKNYQERQEHIQSYTKKIKTELCKNFELKGWCKWGNTCSFAHGKHELRQKTHLHTKYKTNPCKAYHVKGVCDYGQRCQYLHDEVIVLDKRNYRKCIKNPLYEYVNSPQQLQTYTSMMNNVQNGMDFNLLPKRKRLSCFVEICK